MKKNGVPLAHIILLIVLSCSDSLVKSQCCLMIILLRLATELSYLDMSESQVLEEMILLLYFSVRRTDRWTSLYQGLSWCFSSAVCSHTAGHTHRMQCYSPRAASWTWNCSAGTTPSIPELPSVGLHRGRSIFGNWIELVLNWVITINWRKLCL